MSESAENNNALVQDAVARGGPSPAGEVQPRRVLPPPLPPKRSEATPEQLAKYYPERPQPPPPVAPVIAPAPPPPKKKKRVVPPKQKAVVVPEKKPDAVAPQKKAPVTPVAPKKKLLLAPVSDELAEAMAAATAEVETTSAAFTVAGREAAARTARRRLRNQWAKITGAVVGGLVALHLLVTQVVNRAPSDAMLQAYGQGIAGTVVPYYSSVLQPLQVERTVVALNEAVDSRHLRYATEITLRLREPLYKPAFSNGTAAYRQLQESLQSARADELKFKLFEGKTAPEAAELPPLLQVSHPAGQPVVVRVPFEAHRFGWAWRLGPPLLDRRSASQRLEGEALTRFAGAPYLLFEDRATLGEIRRRSALARAYIVAVRAELQKRSQAAPVADASAKAPVVTLPAVTEVQRVGPRSTPPAP
ncbi:MAG TPA: hypothetical protein VM029_22790 [Opitutaceae bacterium]|nr:hypothetical protein [Opitutaceae bacterium]